ncbi:hypothetical protein BpHYR1_003847 [Brachionus plicatilis]|uniref:Uncharacterized protein n=1 Tax=Brachionus plicatilis TaxID=10195 RepID=A0A3M7RWU5_BRAPC|nr:hypothetical protein BpHYR1_003847 [Brachionus plicatilis]
MAVITTVECVTVDKVKVVGQDKFRLATRNVIKPSCSIFSAVRFGLPIMDDLIKVLINLGFLSILFTSLTYDKLFFASTWSM